MPTATFAQRWFEEVWNKGREDAIDEMRAPTARSFGLFHPDAIHSVDGFKEEHRRFTTAFSNINLCVEDEVTPQINAILTPRHSPRKLLLSKFVRNVCTTLSATAS